jgi:sec-independent protein translocase protein TatA
MQATLAFVGGLGGWEILLIVLVLVIFFGAKKIPELARGLGRGIREFKDATKEIKDEIEEGNQNTTAREGNQSTTAKEGHQNTTASKQT